jgi:GAF domain-containing protein/HAMP domain-containing protein
MTLLNSPSPENNIRTAVRAATLITTIVFVVSLCFLFVSMRFQAGSLMIPFGITITIAVTGIVAILFIRRDKIIPSVWVYIAAICLGIPFISLAVKDFGWILLLSVPLLVYPLIKSGLPSNQYWWAFGLGLIGSAAGPVIDIFGSDFRYLIPFSDIIFLFLAVLFVMFGVVIIIRQFPNYTLRTKLLTLFLGVALIPLSILIIVNYQSTRAALTDAANASLSSVAVQNGNLIDDFITNTISELEQEAQLTIFKEVLRSSSLDFPLLFSEVQKTMKLLIDRNPEYLKTYALLDRDGYYLTGSPIISGQVSRFLGINQSVVNGLQISLISNVPYVSPIILDETNQESNIYFATRVNSEDGDILGLLVANYDGSILQDFIRNGNNAAGEDSYGILFDEFHIQLAHGIVPESNNKSVIQLNENLVRTLQDSDRLPDSASNDLSLNLPTLEEGLENSREQPIFTISAIGMIDRTSQVAVHRLTSRPWSVAFFQPQDIFLAPANQQTQFYLVLGLVFAFITTLAAIGAARLIGAPITNLTEIVGEIASGDLSIQVPIQTQDEIGQLGTAFNTMTYQMRNILDGLETQIADRTVELERRAIQLQTAAEVARDASSAKDLDSLLNNAVNLINQHFGFYHAGIFLLDEVGEFAVLRATNSEGGNQMLAQGHKLRVGDVGIVGNTTSTGRPYISLDVETDQTHYAHSFLPETRSEIALPLKVGSEIIGALDVQSKDDGAFTQEDLMILQVLADQLAVAIRNSQLLSEVQLTLNELQSASGDYTRHSWKEWTQGVSASGYRFSGSQVEPIEEQSPEVVEVWENEITVTKSSDSQSTLAIPFKLRDITLGVINLNLETNEITEDLKTLVNDIASRLAVALENARLLEVSQQRAAQQHLIGRVTSKMRETLDVDTVLKNAVSEIREALELHDLVIQLESPNQDTSTN